MKETTLKGLTHLLLAVFAGVEAANAETGGRKFLLGAMMGWHANATFYHFCIEPMEEKR